MTKKFKNNNEGLAQLLNEYNRNNSKEFIARFFENISPLLYKIAYSFTGNTADAQDVLQIALLKILTHSKQCKYASSRDDIGVKMWCISILRNAARAKLKSTSARKMREKTVSERRLMVYFENEEQIRMTDTDHLKQTIEETLLILPEKYRLPITLKYLEGLDYDEIEKLMSIGQNTLRVRVKRGLEKMASLLKEKGVQVAPAIVPVCLEKVIIKMPEMNFQNIINSINHSKSNVILRNPTPKNSLIYFAISIATALGCVLALTILFKATNDGNLVSNELKNNRIRINQIEEKVDSVFDFKDGELHGIKLITGKWQFEKKLKGMYIDENKIVVIQLPIKLKNKNIEIDFDLALQDKDLFFCLIPTISVGEFGLPTKYIEKKYLDSRHTPRYKGKVTFYNNFLITEINGNLLHIYKIDHRPESFDISFIIKSFSVHKISIKEISSLSQPLQHELDLIQEDKMTQYMSFKFDELPGE